MDQSNVRRLRRERGLSQTEVARRSQIDQPSLSKIEAGRLAMYDGWRCRLAVVLECSPELL